MRYREALEPDHDFDLIVVSVQHYSFAEAMSFLAPRAGRATVLVFNNLLVEPAAAVEALPAGQVAWGFPGAGGGFGDGRCAASRAATRRLLRHPRRTAVRARASRTDGVPEAGFSDPGDDRFPGLAVDPLPPERGPAHAEPATGLARRAGRETTATCARRSWPPASCCPSPRPAASTCGDIAASVLPFTAPAWLTAPALAWLFGHFPPMRTVMEAHANPEELRAVCRDTLAEARRLGVSVPRLEASEPYFTAEKLG